MKNKKLKKVIIISVSAVILLILIAILSLVFGLSKVSSKSNPVQFKIDLGRGKKNIVKDLKEAGLIRSEIATYIYLVFNKVDIQAGEYTLNQNMSTPEILKSLNDGKIANEIKITFVEGVTLKNYINQIADVYDLDPNDLFAIIEDKEFIESLIKKYWFLESDILNEDIYYALEGYLFPNTYYFYEDASIEDIIEKMLDETNAKLTPLKAEIEESDYSVHELLTIASIVEREAKSKEDREKVSQVIYKRLAINMSLGMDVTSLYGAKREFGEKADPYVALENPYNTRLASLKGLPVGPICNPSLESITAALHPADTDYIWFFAEKSGKVHFTDNEKEFNTFKEIYKW